MAGLASVDALLLDLDGVFYVGDELMPGARATLDWLKANDVPFRFITNTSTSTPAQLQHKLARLGLDVAEDHVFSSVSATQQFLRAQGLPRCHFLVADAIRPCFAEFPSDDRAPQYVVIGDIGARWDYALLNHAFNLLMSGAQLLCLHRNRYWQTAQGLAMDIGAFVAGLEYVTGQQAIVVGKPSATFFEMALASLELPASRVAVVGDDIESDVGGAQAAALTGVLVQTGKYRAELVARSQVVPACTLASIAELPAVLQQGWRQR